MSIVFKFREIWPTGNRALFYLLDKKNVATARIAPNKCTPSAPDLIKIFSLLAEL